MYPSLIVPAMRKTAFLLAISLISAGSALAQTTEFGVLFGGSKRVIKSHEPAPGTELTSDGFKFSNSAVDIYYALQADPGTMFKTQVRRTDTPAAIPETTAGS